MNDQTNFNNHPYAAPATHPTTPQPHSAAMYATSQADSRATTSMVLGLIAIVAWIIPLIGYPVTITGFVKGIRGMKSNRSGQAVTGIVLNILFFGATVINSAVGVMMMMR